jgi:Cu(I)/Ag(I) efflux system membrane fusion protein
MSEQEIVVNALKTIKSKSSVREQRLVFDKLSTSLIKVAQAFGLYDQNYKIQYCPMVNNNKGAYWISKQNVIRNPYYGNQMLTCGEVKDSITERKIQSVNPAPTQRHNH